MQQVYTHILQYTGLSYMFYGSSVCVLRCKQLLHAYCVHLICRLLDNDQQVARAYALLQASIA
jgi:hypothetical protein